MRYCSVVMLLVVGAQPALAQWNPGSGQWGKSDPSDLRIMSWNVFDGICSTQIKTPNGSWDALARIVAAMQPDILILQEVGDNSGNGTCSGFCSVDTVPNLETTLDLFMYGGTDPFKGGSVSSYVQLHAPSYDLPHVFVSFISDGFNRNVIMSRYPFEDLNGDTRAIMADIPLVLAGAGSWGTGGTGGIRGAQFTEIVLPNAIYAGDFVMGNVHLKCCFDGAAQRLAAAQNISYVLQYWYNADGGSTPDPLGMILDNPVATHPLDANTPVVVGGDYNEVESTFSKGPVGWMGEGQITGGFFDGTDRDFSDGSQDFSTNPFTGSQATKGGSKLDYFVYQDSIITVTREFVFRTSSSEAQFPSSAVPPELSGFFNPDVASNIASDHYPVIMDLNLPKADCDDDGTLDLNEPDTDGDDVIDDCDNCPAIANTDQADCDDDGLGDVCETDADGDDVPDDCDNCLGISNPDQNDCNDDSVGDACEADGDADGVPNDCDNCLTVSNPGQEDCDTDGIGDACESDGDGDGVVDGCDNCPALSNPDQEDCDTDGVGDACSDDWDGDGITDGCDNCPYNFNPDQLDTSGSELGDACENICQDDLGFAGPGSGSLSSCGPTLFSGQSSFLTLFFGPANQPAFLLIGFQNTPVPFAGGTLIPFPNPIILNFTTNFLGVVNIPFNGGNGPFDLYAQFVIVDPSQPFGYSITNALRLEFLP